MIVEHNKQETYYVNTTKSHSKVTFSSLLCSVLFAAFTSVSTVDQSSEEAFVRWKVFSLRHV